MKFKDWILNKIKVGSFPYQFNSNFDAAKYDIVINVSDEWDREIEIKLKQQDCETYWFPMNECKKDIGLNSVYAALRILYHAETNNKSVYLHCHAGANRSPTIFAAYFYMRTGKHLEENKGGYINRLVANCNRGYLPPKAEMEQFLTKYGERLKMKYKGGLDSLKLDTINNF